MCNMYYFFALYQCDEHKETVQYIIIQLATQILCPHGFLACLLFDQSQACHFVTNFQKVGAYSDWFKRSIWRYWRYLLTNLAFYSSLKYVHLNIMLQSISFLFAYLLTTLERYILSICLCSVDFYNIHTGSVFWVNHYCILIYIVASVCHMIFFILELSDILHHVYTWKSQLKCVFM